MGNARSGVGRRARAYAYWLVTTTIVLVFALAEWAAEKLIAAHSRSAGTAIEVAIVLVAAVVFRPIHQRVEAAVEAAFYRHKHQALEALAHLRRELTSYNDAAQLLRRVIEAVDRYPDTSACAVYLRRDTFRAEASSFDVALEDVGVDDPLVVRLRSSGAPAQPRSLTTAVTASHVFPMTAGGDLVGFLAVGGEHDDEDELAMLGGLARDLAVALAAIDPRLRAKTRGVPNNIPIGLPPVIGRGREMEEIKAALERSRLVTVTGSGGVGKTRIALQCAADLVESREHGAWFVNLAPITDGDLVAATMLAALEVGSAESGDDGARLVAHLQPRNALLVIDNCEQVVEHVASLVKEIRARCPRVAFLTTSRELLRLDDEQVYRLASLRPDDAVELFVQRAAAVSPEFSTDQRADTVRSICERLDCIPLAIELAAARVRTLSVGEIHERLHERFRLLTSAERDALPRRQTLAAMIQWSYDLLPPHEREFFRRLCAFRGTFSLAAAAAVAGDDVDDYRTLDLLTSLADKSLLAVKVALRTRYGMLETIREFAAQKAAEEKDADVAAGRHAAHFAAVAAQAYHDFDSRPAGDWLERLAPDVDNFRAGLEWTLESRGDRAVGAQLAADSGPLFLRLALLSEGLRWCERGLAVAGIPAATAGRLEYVASMMHNNALAYPLALASAQRAVSHFRRSSDERGLVRALSQTAHQFARSRQYEQARAPAAEAIERARALGDPHVLIAVLRRCASALPPEDIEQARRFFEEALDAANRIQDRAETRHLLQWWAASEGAARSYDRAIELLLGALDGADLDHQKYIESDIACCAWAAGAVETAGNHARRSLELARAAQHPVLSALAMAYCAPVHALHAPDQGARIFGAARERLRGLGFEGDQIEKVAMENASLAIAAALGDADIAPLLREGASLSPEAALAILDS